MEFPDGTTVTDPYEDALGRVYENRDNYIHGDNPHEVEPAMPDDSTAEARPSR